MSDDDKTGYGNPPKKNQFKPGQSGNLKGRPKKSESMQRISMDSLRHFIMNGATKEVKITENGKEKNVPILFVIVSQLYNKAAKGDTRATKMALDMLHKASAGNDKELYEWLNAWSKMQERLLKSSRILGSLEHFDALYQYYMFKKDIRKLEGVETWPYEDFEPITNEDWHVFITHHEKLKDTPNYLAPWPLKYPSDDPEG